MTTWNDAALKAACRIEHGRIDAVEPDLGMLSYYAQRLSHLTIDRFDFNPAMWVHIAQEAMWAIPGWTPELCVDMLVGKQADYGHGNINAFGHIGIAVRLCDKIARLRNLAGRPDTAVNESYLDTLNDIVGYCVIALMLDNNTFNLTLA